MDWILSTLRIKGQKERSFNILGLTMNHYCVLRKFLHCLCKEYFSMDCVATVLNEVAPKVIP